MYLLQQKLCLLGSLPDSGKQSFPHIDQEILVRSSSFSPTSRLVLPTIILNKQRKLPVAALIDSGAKQNLISQDLVDQLVIPMQTLQSPLIVDKIQPVDL